MGEKLTAGTATFASFPLATESNQRIPYHWSVKAYGPKYRVAPPTVLATLRFLVSADFPQKPHHEPPPQSEKDRCCGRPEHQTFRHGVGEPRRSSLRQCAQAFTPSSTPRRPWAPAFALRGTKTDRRLHEVPGRR
jgi:hypothetical protein